MIQPIAMGLPCLSFPSAPWKEKLEERSLPGHVTLYSTGIPPTGECDQLEPIDGVSVSNQSFESSLVL